MKNFTSPLPFTSLDDEHFIQNKAVLTWMENWEDEVRQKEDLTTSETNKLLFSDRLQFDLKSMIIGFEQICSISFELNPGCVIKSMFFNSDLVENIFCEIRGGNGQNSNPTYCQYGPSMNSILLGQTTSTTKSNTGKTSTFSFSRPKKASI